MEFSFLFWDFSRLWSYYTSPKGDIELSYLGTGN